MKRKPETKILLTCYIPERLYNKYKIKCLKNSMSMDTETVYLIWEWVNGIYQKNKEE